VAFGVVWFLVTISPVANVVFLSGILLAERNLYLPSVGFVAAVGWLVLRLSQTRPRGAQVVVALTVALMGWRTWERNPTWRDTGTVFTALIGDYPHSGRAQWMLGILRFERGQVSEGLVSFRAAIGILGAHYPVVVEVAKKLMAREQYASARRLLEIAWKEHPEIPLAPELLAVIHSEQGNAEEAERFCRIALALDDEEVIPWHLLAWALAEQGRWEEAAEARRGAIAHGEAHAWQQWVSLAYLRDQTGDTAEVRAALDSAAVRADSRFARFQIDSLRAAFLGGPLPSRPEPEGPSRP
jgi:tetratricopeptide (TPR) repeat protein